jgi:hypothetical protein
VIPYLRKLKPNYNKTTDHRLTSWIAILARYARYIQAKIQYNQPHLRKYTVPAFANRRTFQYILAIRVESHIPQPSHSVRFSRMEREITVS